MPRRKERPSNSPATLHLPVPVAVPLLDDEASRLLRPSTVGVAVAALVGLGLFLVCEDYTPGHFPAAVVQWTATLAAALAGALFGFFTPVRSKPSPFLDRLRRPSSQLAWGLALIITILCARYFQFTGTWQGRDFLPKYHDEFMYLLQSQMLARGRLWMPQHPLAEFFETFHVLVKPVYAPIYFPGTALLYAPLAFVKFSPWGLSILLCGAIVGMTYRLFTRWFDGLAGLLAALLVLGLAQLHFLSLMVMSHSLLLLLALLLAWAWTGWREATGDTADAPASAWRPAGWAVAMGAFSGWAAITRPVDAACYALPIAAAVVWRLRRRPWRLWAATLLPAAIAAAPFLSLQLALDYGVTGNVLRTPATLYAQTYWPGILIGSNHFDPSFRPPSRLPQVREWYETFVLPHLQTYYQDGRVRSWLKRWPEIFQATLPTPLLLTLAVPGALAVLRRGRGKSLARGGGREGGVMLGALLLFSVAFAFNPIFLKHYAFVMALPMALLTLAGARAVVGTLADTWAERRPRAARAVAYALPLALVAASVTGLAEANPFVKDPDFSAPFLDRLTLQLADLPAEPAVVLFRYEPGTDFHEEMVYNVEAAWPDDEQIIRAHDLGPQEDRKIFAYYAERSPGRMFYLYDRRTQQLTPLGRAGDWLLWFPVNYPRR